MKELCDQKAELCYLFTILSPMSGKKKRKKEKQHSVGTDEEMHNELWSFTSNTASTVSSWSSRRVILLEIFLMVCMDCRRTSSISSLNMSTRKSRHFSAKEGEDWASMQSASTAAMRTSREKGTNKTVRQVKTHGWNARTSHSGLCFPLYSSHSANSFWEISSKPVDSATAFTWTYKQGCWYHKNWGLDLKFTDMWSSHMPISINLNFLKTLLSYLSIPTTVVF